MVGDTRHVTEATGNLVAELAVADRAQCIMAPGTGMAAVLAGTARQSMDAGAKRIFGYAHTAERLQENARMLRAALGPEVPIVIVAETSGSPDVEAIAEPDELRAAMERLDGRAAVFLATFDSAKKLSEAQNDDSGRRFAADMALIDQAQWTAGNSLAAPYAHVLSDENVDIRKRAFFTSTPRAVEAATIRGDALSMSDEAFYGRRAVDFSFSQALERDLVADYDIWVSVVGEDEISARSGLATLSDAERHAIVGDIALHRVMERTGHKRALTFHNRREQGRTFAALAERDDLPSAFIDHKSPDDHRRQAMALLEDKDGILSNVGVIGDDANFPRLETVAFLGRTESVSRTVQALSQATRRDPANPGKRAAIVIPVVLDDPSEAALERATREQGFQTLVDVARAMRLTDDTLDNTLRQLARMSGEEQEFSLPQVKVVGAPGTSPELASRIDKALKVATVREISEPFDIRFGELGRFISQHGHLPTLEEDETLGSWVTKARLDHKSGRLPLEHAKALDEMPGWSWVDPKASGRVVAQHLARYAARHGDVPPYRIAPGMHSGAEDLGRYMFDAEKARLDVRRDPEFHIGSRRRAEGLAKSIGLHVQETGDRRLMRQVPRTDLRGMRGVLTEESGKDGETYLAFRPFDARIPHFDTGILRDGNKAHFRLSDLEAGQEESLRGLLTNTGHGMRAILDLELAPVLGKDGEYLLDRARVGSISEARRATNRAPLQQSTPKQTDVNATATSWGNFYRERENGKIETFFRIHRAGDYQGKSAVLRVADISGEADRLLEHLPRANYGIAMTFSMQGQSTGIPSVSVSKIHTGKVLRPAETSFTATYLANRIEDRNIAGLPPYSIANLRGRDREGVPLTALTATTLNPNARTVPVSRIRKGIDDMQRAHAEGKVTRGTALSFDELKGMSWFEKENLRGLFAPAIQQIAQRHGRDILASSDAREGEGCLASSLRLADDVVARPSFYPQAREDLSALKEDGLIMVLKAAGRRPRGKEDVARSRARGAFDATGSLLD